MPDLIIKPQNTSGDKIIIQDQAGGAVLTTADSGATITLNGGDLVPSSPLSHRNMIINGGMQIWQRGNATTGASTYRQDRFKIERRGSTTPAVDRSTDIPTGEGFAYSARMYATAGTDDGFHYYTTVELPGTGRYGLFETGTKMILSFWIKSAYSGQTITPVMNLKDSLTGSNSSTALNSTEGATAIPTSWTRLTFNFTMPSWAADTGSLGNVACAAIRHLIGSDNTPQDIYVTGVQLELGSNATPFEHRSYADELARCQRYFIRYGDGTNAQAIGTGTVYNSVNNIFHVHLPVTMRARPTAVKILDGNSQWMNTYVGASGNIANPGIELGEGESTNVHRIYCTNATVSSTTGYASWAILTAGGGFTLSAEL